MALGFGCERTHAVPSDGADLPCHPGPGWGSPWRPPPIAAARAAKWGLGTPWCGAPAGGGSRHANIFALRTGEPECVTASMRTAGALSATCGVKDARYR